MKTKFRELKFLSGLFKMIGGIELVFGIISMILLPELKFGGQFYAPAPDG